MTNDSVNEPEAEQAVAAQPLELREPTVPPRTSQSWLLTIIATIPLLLALAVAVGADECTRVEGLYLVVSGALAVAAIALAWMKGDERSARRTLLLSLGLTALAWLFVIRQAVIAAYAVGCDLSTL